MDEASSSLISRDVAAQRVGVHKRTIRRWELEGHLARVVDMGEGGTVRYRTEDIDRLMQEHTPRHRWEH